MRLRPTGKPLEAPLLSLCAVIIANIGDIIYNATVSGSAESFEAKLEALSNIESVEASTSACNLISQSIGPSMQS